VVEATAILNLSILANNVVIHGRVHGPVVATGIVDVRSTGRVIGDIKAAKIIVRDGAAIEGRCEMTRPPPSKPRQTPTSPPDQGPPLAEDVPPERQPVDPPVPRRFPVVQAKPLPPPPSRIPSPNPA
jgi:cytoskeletal protein CcmA (bactofilin family)